MIRAAVIAAALGLVGACARAPAPRDLSPESCTGKLYLDVHNPLSLSIDVYEGDRTRRDTARLVGTAPHGDTRLPITHPVTRIFAVDANGQGLTMEPTATTIRSQMVCVG